MSRGRGLLFFPLYPEDFASDRMVEAMTTEGVGAYFLLLCKAWREDPPASVPDDDRILARWARVTPARWKNLRAMVLAPFHKREDGRLYQKRLRRIYEELIEKSSKAREAAETRWAEQRAGGAKPEQSERNAGVDANALPRQSGRIADGMPLPSLSISNSSRSTFKPPSLEEVEAYWIEKALRGSPEKFFERHTAGGWHYGRTKMVDWKAAARTWSLHEGEVGRGAVGGKLRNAVHRPGEYEDVKSEVIE